MAATGYTYNCDSLVLKQNLNSYEDGTEDLQSSKVLLKIARRTS